MFKNSHLRKQSNKNTSICIANVCRKNYMYVFVLQGLLEGSQEYVSLEQAAREYFQSHSIQSQPSTGQLILDLLNTLDLDIDEMKKGEAGLPPSDGNVSCLFHIYCPYSQ